MKKQKTRSQNRKSNQVRGAKSKECKLESYITLFDEYLKNQRCRLKRNYSHPDWLHIAHSEGGLIARDTLAGLSYETSRYCQNHLIVHTYGSVQPIAKHAVKAAFNFYASHDVAYRQYGINYEKNDNFEIKVIDSKKIPSISIPGDHGFLGATYPIVLKENMDEFREEKRFYDAKN